MAPAKTTFLKIAATPREGDARKNLIINGNSIADEPERARAEIGFLSHNTYVYRDLSPGGKPAIFRTAITASPDIEARHTSTARTRRRPAKETSQRSRGARSPARPSPGASGIARGLFSTIRRWSCWTRPYAGLDANAVAMLDDLLDETIKAGKTVILITHDLEQGLRAASQGGDHRSRQTSLISGSARDQATRDAYLEYVRGGSGTMEADPGADFLKTSRLNGVTRNPSVRCSCSAC